MDKPQTIDPLKLRIDRSAFSVGSLLDESDEPAYWQRQSAQQRLLHIERLRRINYGHLATARLQRFFEVVERRAS